MTYHRQEHICSFSGLKTPEKTIKEGRHLERCKKRHSNARSRNQETLSSATESTTHLVFGRMVVTPASSTGRLNLLTGSFRDPSLLELRVLASPVPKHLITKLLQLFLVQISKPDQLILAPGAKEHTLTRTHFHLAAHSALPDTLPVPFPRVLEHTVRTSNWTRRSALTGVLRQATIRTPRMPCSRITAAFQGKVVQDCWLFECALEVSQNLLNAGSQLRLPCAHICAPILFCCSKIWTCKTGTQHIVHRTYASCKCVVADVPAQPAPSSPFTKPRWKGFTQAERPGWQSLIVVCTDCTAGIDAG